MPYRLESVELLIRPTTPDRMSFAIGGVAKKRRPLAILVAKVAVADDRGHRSWGVSADRPSFGWLDKRRSSTPVEMLERLFDLCRAAREVYLEQPRFDSPFALWRRCWPGVLKIARQREHESLSASYASSLLERAVLDAVCRLQEVNVFQAITGPVSGFDPSGVHPQLAKFPWRRFLPRRPRSRFHIRHTVGLSDPLSKEDLPADRRVNDGEPETLQEYIERDGLRYFKVKVSGDADRDLERLAKVWAQLVRVNQPVVTLDGNESYRDLGEFARFVERLEREQLGLYQHILFIEQPLPRSLTFDKSSAPAIEEIRKKKPLVIDEADGETDSFSKALQLGYDGVSHKNCKGFFKSLANYCLCAAHNDAAENDAANAGPSRGRRMAFQTGEDLSTMPVVAIQQDFAALGVLNIEHCERNGHHYGFGLSHIDDAERSELLRLHSDLYTRRDEMTFLNIRDGQVTCGSLHEYPGFGVSTEPNWNQLTPLDQWEFAW